MSEFYYNPFQKEFAGHKSTYVLIEQKGAITYRGRVDMENGTGWEVLITLLPSGKVGIAIDRKGFFVFRSIESLTNPKPEDVAPYLGEKLFLCESDAILMAHFLRHFFGDMGVIHENTSRV
jgi:hypothetical protein